MTGGQLAATEFAGGFFAAGGRGGFRSPAAPPGPRREYWHCGHPSPRHAGAACFHSPPPRRPPVSPSAIQGIGSFPSSNATPVNPSDTILAESIISRYDTN